MNRGGQVIKLCKGKTDKALKSLPLPQGKSEGRKPSAEKEPQDPGDLFVSLPCSYPFCPKTVHMKVGGLGPCPSPWEMSSFPSPPLAQGSGLARDYSRAPLPLPRPGMGRALVSWEQGNSLAILLTSLGITKLRGNLSLGIFFLAFKAISVSRKLNPCVFGLIT